MTDAKTADPNRRQRPLSPHLQIYRWEWTMVYSILHRMTGVALAVGALLLVWWLLALAAGPEAFALFRSLTGGWFGQLLLFGWSFALFYHLCNGLRHLAWDGGIGFDLDHAARSGHLVCGAALVLTLGLWAGFYAR